MKKERLVNSMLIITIANILGKVLGFVKNIIFSYYYGANLKTDAFILAESIPLFLLGIFTSSVDSAVIPQYTRINLQNGREKADENFSNILNIIVVIAILVGFIILLCPSAFVKIFAPGFSNETRIYAEKFLSFFSFIGLFHIIYCFCCAYSAAYNRILVRSVVSVLPNVIILCALVIYHDSNMMGITLAYVVTYFLSAFIPFFLICKDGYKYSKVIDFRSKELQKFVFLFLPIIGVAILSELQLFVDRFLASSIDGGISYLNYASRITSIFDAVLVSGIGIVVLPVLSKYNQNKEIKKMIEISCKIVKYLVMGLMIIACICIVYSDEIISVIYGRGEFRQDSIKNVAGILRVYSVDIVLFPVQTIIIRFFHSMENTKLPFKINCITVVVNIISSIILSRYMGLKGIAVGTVISFALSIFILLIALMQKAGWNKKELGMKHLIIMLMSAGLSILLMIELRECIASSVFKIILGSLSGMFCYALLLFLFLKKERKEIFEHIKYRS